MSTLQNILKKAIEDLESIAAPAVVEDYNNFIAEAGEIGELDLEEMVVERTKPILEKTAQQLLSAVVEDTLKIAEGMMVDETFADFSDALKFHLTEASKGKK